MGGMAARRAALASARRLSERWSPERGFPRWFPERWFPDRPDLERPDRVADGSDRVADGSDRASAGAASSACDDITDRDSIPAGRISLIGPQYLTLFRR
jgi:hypothetical protein